MAGKSSARKRKKAGKKPPSRKKSVRRKKPLRKKRPLVKKSPAARARKTKPVKFDAIHAAHDLEESEHKHEPFDEDFPPDFGGSQ
jgi:hypothetical protein